MMRWERRSFRAMGTEVALAASGRAEAFVNAFRIVQNVFRSEEQRFSRFRDDSELSRVNARSGEWTDVSEPFADLTRLAISSAERTGGIFDPTVLPALRAAGYDRDIDEVRAILRELPPTPPEPCGRWAEIELDGNSIHMPKGVALDFGGIAKGWTVDRAATLVAREVTCALVSAGGDLRAVGAVPAEGLPIEVEDPLQLGSYMMTLALGGGAIATSSTMRRSWGKDLHHLIDPRTSLPARTGIVQATVWAETCAEAEIDAKWALLDGVPALDHISAVLVRESGEVLVNLRPMEVAA